MSDVPMHDRVGPLLFALALSACAATADEPHAVVRSSRVVGDTVVMEVRGFGGPNVEVVKEGVIGGALATAGPYQFSSIGAFAVDRRGWVFAYDDGSKELRVFDAGGRYVRKIGRPGAGPGEYRHIGGIAIAPDGRVVVSDPFNGRIVIYAADGTAKAHIPRRFGTVVQALSAVWIDSARNIILPLDPFGPGSVRDDSSRAVFVRLSRDGQMTDTLYAPSKVFTRCPTRPETRFRSGFLQDIREPYVLKPRWGLTAAGDVIAGCPESYRFDVLRKGDGVMRVAVTDWTPVAVSTDELQNHMDRWSRSKRLSGLAAGFSWNDAHLLQRKPAYDFFLTDPSGRIWVWVPQSSIEVPVRGRVGPDARDTKWIDPPNPVFDVFASDGGWIGRVRIPSNVSFEPNPRVVPPVVRGDTLWALTRDSLGIETITRFQLDFPPDGR